MQGIGYGRDILSPWGNFKYGRQEEPETVLSTLWLESDLFYFLSLSTIKDVASKLKPCPYEPNVLTQCAGVQSQNVSLSFYTLHGICNDFLEYDNRLFVHLKRFFTS